MEPYQQLEKEWAEFNDLDPTGMVACSSGTAALHLALEALRLPQGSQVITSDYNMIAVPRAITLAGLTPVFVDCDDRLLLDTDLIIEGSRGGHNRAVVAVHIYGRPINMEKVHDEVYVAQQGRQSVSIIEDLAEAHGLTPHPKTDVACWSFYKNKIVAGEEGGAVWFKDQSNADLARQLRSLGFTAEHDYNHVPRGHNYRMSNLHATRILDRTQNRWGSVGDAEDNLRRRREIEGWYEFNCPIDWLQSARQCPWVYDFRIPGINYYTQGRVVKSLQDAGIPARHGFKSMHRQEEYCGCTFVKSGPFARSSLLSSEIIYLPIQPGVTTAQECKRAFDILRCNVNL